ncbi:hypothetical protein [Variovorax sp. PCZ-1]|uniref:DUF3592 domain-containing protein n=1 Tax=Variovorax sp. PCZ-1 TaxID=2835533 RepID=UPI001BCF5E47|nr:hypothetical protein [Variovorax sp. PCZ-1]MBS7808253.1 hypothetical protein [Variovorax sp. PCZ-1]
MRPHIGLLIAALLLSGVSVVSWVDYVKRIEGPVILRSDSNLTSIPGRSIAVDCRKYYSKGTTGRLLAEPNVQYSYSFSGITHQGYRHSRTQKYQLMTPEECDEFAREFLKNRSVNVWIDPSNPSYAVLNPHLPFPWIEVFAALGGLLAFISSGYLKLAQSRRAST